ncbi:MAG: aldo/keto reductase [Myxococcales bacterium]|nr:aldo/keto reductase [Myxococcales bacterium]
MLDTLPFGTTGHQSSRVIFGAAAMAAASDRLSDQILATLLEFGVNHIDTAASYGDSELHLARWMPEHREHFFLASKAGDRTGDGARRSLERSLERLGVDHLDLIQLHNLVEEADWQQAFAKDGAVAALFRARDEGLCRNVGVTGHGLRIPRMLLRSLAEAPFASVLFPYNHILLQDAAYAADVEELLAVCAERSIAAQTIKSVARRRWTDDAGPRFSWYEPLSEPGALTRAVGFVLDNPQVFLNTSSDARILRPTLEAAAAANPAPHPSELASDRETHAMQPLFDGGALEVI